MEIFRHYYTSAELNTLVFHNSQLNSFGFCNLDGSKINNYTWYDTALNFRYSLDTKKQSYFIQNTPSHYNYYGYRYIRNLGKIGFHRSDGVTTTIITDQASSSTGMPSTLVATVVFLPLKNNGFLLNIRSDTMRDYATFHIGTNMNDSRDYNFNVATPSPTLQTKTYGTNYIANCWASGVPGVITIIGIPPCKSNLNWTYIFYGITCYYLDGGNYYTYNTAIIDYGDGKVINLPYKSNFIKTINGPAAYNELTYTNVNENVCSMIKMPYDNGYIDGIYLLTTAPQQLEDATFFSFDGRNFLNVFDNYVVELPSST